MEYDYRDIRWLDVYKVSGELVGTVYAPKSWRRYPHSIKTRQYICRYARQQRIIMSDPLVEYFWLQINRKHAAKGALEAIRLYREYTAQSPRMDAIPTSHVPLEGVKLTHETSRPRAAEATSPVPPWSTEMAYGLHRKDP